MPFYAVRQGIIPGIYTSWPAAQAQVKGYKGAEYKKFETKEDAFDYIHAKSAPVVITNIKEPEIVTTNVVDWGIDYIDKNELVKLQLEGILEGLKERDVSFILDKVNEVANILEIKDWQQQNIKEFAR